MHYFKYKKDISDQTSKRPINADDYNVFHLPDDRKFYIKAAASYIINCINTYIINYITFEISYMID